MNSTERFTDRVADYVKYRPSYPAAAIDLLADNCGLVSGAKVADVGSGTGILTRLLLEREATVYAVEPNAAMREAAESLLSGKAGFISLDGTAEATGLPGSAIDLYTASQAFHWFDGPTAREECLRILRPGGCAALLWNSRMQASSDFLSAYEELLKSLPSYTLVNHKDQPEEEIEAFFGSGRMRKHVFPNAQSLDWEGLLGRAASSSYFPRPGDSQWARTVNRLHTIFEREALGGRVAFLYDCEVFIGQPS